MTFTFRPAARENVGLLIGLAGASGSGKTYTAMRLAKGMAGDAPFAVIDTEAGRSKHYADQFRFDHGDLKPPFSPAAYADAIKAADDAKYPVIVVDSFSHEHAGEGGLLDMQEAEFARMDGREAMKMASWIKPKGEHRRMVQRVLQIRAHLILCFRAEEKIEMVRNQDGKMEVRKKQTLTGLDGWVPICEKTLPYELTVSVLLMPSRPGVPIPIKLQEQHRPMFPLEQPISEDAGRRLAEWAQGGTAKRPGDSGTVPEHHHIPTPAPSPQEDRAALLREIKRLADGAKLDGKSRSKAWRTYCGEAKPATADLSALADLLAWVKTRAAA